MKYKLTALIFTIVFIVVDLAIGFSMFWLWNKLFGSGFIGSAFIIITIVLIVVNIYKQFGWLVDKWGEK